MLFAVAITHMATFTAGGHEFRARQLRQDAAATGAASSSDNNMFPSWLFNFMAPSQSAAAAAARQVPGPCPHLNAGRYLRRSFTTRLKATLCFSRRQQMYPVSLLLTCTPARQGNNGMQYLQRHGPTQ